MDRERKKAIWQTAGCLVLMFVWLLLAVLLTGSREISEFTPADRQIMGVFAALELATVAAAFFFAVRCGRLMAAGNQLQSKTPALPEEPESDTQRIARRRSNALGILACVLAAAAEIAGIWAGRRLPPAERSALVPALIAGLLLPPLLAGLNLLLVRSVRKRFERMNAQESQQWMLSHREQAAQTAARELRSLQRLRRGTGLYAALLFLLGLGDAFLVGACTDGGLLTVLVLLSVYPAASGLMRLRFAPPKSFFNDNGCYLAEEDFPQLYALCRRAAEQLGRRGRIHVGLTPDVNAGIAEIGGEYSVLLGTGLLALFSSEEIYHVLLHEFMHLHAPQVQREGRYRFWLENESGCGALSALRGALFRFADMEYSLHAMLYRFAASIEEETRADRAMADYGDAAVAASALLKLKYAELCAWEQEGQASPAPETMADKLHALVIGRTEAVRRAFSERAGFYNGLIEKEIIARSASHPTLRMRLETLGVRRLRLCEGADEPLLRAEADRAPGVLEAWLKPFNPEKDYAEYLAGLRKTAAAWEEAGRPLHEQEYPDTVAALKELGRLDEAMELCQRAIGELPGGGATDYALFMRGCCRLHRWDDGGLEDLFTALESNSNYIEKGLDQIGSYCCMTGNQAQLDRYREMAPILAQKKKDESEKLFTLTKDDDLRGETLPPEIDQKIRDYLAEIDCGQFDRLYLLRKQVDPALYTSAMVVCFRPDAAMERRRESMHKIFLCLDNISDWQFSLYDIDELKGIRPDEIEGSLFYLGKRDE